MCIYLMKRQVRVSMMIAEEQKCQQIQAEDEEIRERENFCINIS